MRTSAFYMGRKAWIYKLATECPFASGTEQATDWMAGYTEAKRMMGIFC